jgi:hypothetical protein
MKWKTIVTGKLDFCDPIVEVNIGVMILSRILKQAESFHNSRHLEHHSTMVCLNAGIELY